MSRSRFPINIFQNRRFIPRFHWGGLNDLINGRQQTYPENEDEDEDEDGKEAKNIRNAFSLFGSIASPLLGIGGAVLNKAMANSNMMANDYYNRSKFLLSCYLKRINMDH